ncbi:MAG: FUSC family protein, partial [Xanthobacteraceae bacterium]
AVAYLRASRAALLARDTPPPLDDFEAALGRYIAAVATVRHEGRTRTLPVDVIERFFTVGFALEQLHQNFLDLHRCVASWSKAGGGARPVS